MKNVIDDSELLQNVFTHIVNGLKAKNIDFNDFEYNWYMYEELGMVDTKISIIIASGEVLNEVINHDDSPDLSPAIRSLYYQMKDRGDHWKSMKFKFQKDKVTVNFSYEDNPSPG